MTQEQMNCLEQFYKFDINHGFINLISIVKSKLIIFPVWLF